MQVGEHKDGCNAAGTYPVVLLFDLSKRGPAVAFKMLSTSTVLYYNTGRINNSFTTPFHPLFTRGKDFRWNRAKKCYDWTILPGEDPEKLVEGDRTMISAEIVAFADSMERGEVAEKFSNDLKRCWPLMVELGRRQAARNAAMQAPGQNGGDGAATASETTAAAATTPGTTPTEPLQGNPPSIVVGAGQKGTPTQGDGTTKGAGDKGSGSSATHLGEDTIQMMMAKLNSLATSMSELYDKVEGNGTKGDPGKDIEARLRDLRQKEQNDTRSSGDQGVERVLGLSPLVREQSDLHVLTTTNQAGRVPRPVDSSSEIGTRSENDIRVVGYDPLTRRGGFEEKGYSKEFTNLLRDTVKGLFKFDGKMTKENLCSWLTKWDMLFKTARTASERQSVTQQLLIKVEGPAFEVINGLVEEKTPWEEIKKRVEEDFTINGGLRGTVFEWQNLKQGSNTMTIHLAKVRRIWRELKWEVNECDYTRNLPFCWSCTSLPIQEKLLRKAKTKTMAELLEIARQMDLQSNQRLMGSGVDVDQAAAGQNTVMVTHTSHQQQQKTPQKGYCPIHQTTSHGVEECRNKQATTCPQCHEAVQAGTLIDHMSGCSAKRCFGCGKLGHIRANCRTNPGYGGRPHDRTPYQRDYRSGRGHERRGRSRERRTDDRDRRHRRDDTRREGHRHGGHDNKRKSRDDGHRDHKRRRINVARRTSSSSRSRSRSMTVSKSRSRSRGRRSSRSSSRR